MKEIWDFTAPDDDGEAGRPSDLELDQLRAGELDEATAARLHTRLAESPADRARFEALDRHFDDIDEVDPRRLLAAIRREAQPPPSLFDRLRARWALAVGALALVGAAVAVFALRPTDDPDGPDIVTVKGGPVLFVQRRGDDGRGEPLERAQPVAPGDTLKFAISLPSAAAVRVIGVEAGGARYDAFPLDGGPSPVMGPGERIELPGAVTLDDAPGRETLYLVACPAPGEPSACTPTGDGLDCPAGCRYDAFALDKRSGPP